MSGHVKLRGLYAITDAHLMPRDRFETLFPQLVTALGLGTPLAR